MFAKNDFLYSIIFYILYLITFDLFQFNFNSFSFWRDVGTNIKESITGYTG